MSIAKNHNNGLFDNDDGVNCHFKSKSHAKSTVNFHTDYVIVMIGMIQFMHSALMRPDDCDWPETVF